MRLTSVTSMEPTPVARILSTGSSAMRASLPASGGAGPGLPQQGAEPGAGAAVAACVFEVAWSLAAEDAGLVVAEVEAAVEALAVAPVGASGAALGMDHELQAAAAWAWSAIEEYGELP